MTTDAQEAPRRRYSSARRDRQAAQTRSEILVAAVAMFGECGWSGTTLQAVADRAGVAVETIYSGFRSKKQLLRAALDAAIAGDTTGAQLADRPDYQDMGSGDPERRLRTGVRLLVALHARTVPVWRAMRQAAGGDEEVAAWCEEYERNRRTELSGALAVVLGRPVTGSLLDLFWAYLGPEVYAQLVLERGWPASRYEKWMVHTVQALT